MATDEKRDGARTKITLAAHGGLIKVEIAPGLDGRVVLSADDGEVALGLLIGVEEQEMVIDAIRRAQGRHAPASTPLEERLADAASAVDRDASELDYGPMRWEMRGRAEGLRAALAMVREQGPTVPRAAIEELRDTILGWEKACVRGSYEDGRAAAILDCVAVIDTMLGTKDPGHADD